MQSYLISFDIDDFKNQFFIATDCDDLGQAIDQLREAHPSAVVRDSSCIEE
jgi:hypothetical protein